LNSLNDFRGKVEELAKAKGYNQDEAWLEAKFFKEAGEMMTAIEDGLSEEEIAEEGSDVLHMFFQLMEKNAKSVNLDISMNNKITSNYKTKKKTYDGGKIVRK